MEDDTNFLNKKIGTKEKEALIKPAKCTIVNVQIKKSTKDGKTMSTPLLVVQVKHPDKDELLSISKIKCIRNEKVQTVGLWVQTDSDDNIEKSSAVASLLTFLKVNSISELMNKEIETIEESEQVAYLVLKAY